VVSRHDLILSTQIEKAKLLKVKAKAKKAAAKKAAKAKPEVADSSETSE